jgi:hypothetical protein
MLLVPMLVTGCVSLPKKENTPRSIASIQNEPIHVNSLPQPAKEEDIQILEVFEYPKSVVPIRQKEVFTEAYLVNQSLGKNKAIFLHGTWITFKLFDSKWIVDEATPTDFEKIFEKKIPTKTMVITE